ncbi:ribonuclease P protein subunit [Candidatus Woesearchaeota archaeon]|nr:ribonuclease P protein subunit [Candidatus Woesearchaeota archaeon]
MGINIKDIVKHELIGLKIKVVDSKNKTNIGIKGKIIDETKYTIIVESKGEKKRLFKNNITIDVYADRNIARINGKLLSGRPKERVKSKW